MEETVRELPAEVADALELGQLMGQNQTFGLVAARCSAAHAASLRRLRQEEKYKLVTPRWRDFCAQYLKMSGTEADRIIRYLEEFGPGYFDLAQLVRISPDTYRAIAPAIRDGALHAGGDTIELSVENARKLTAAVAELRRTLPEKPKKSKAPRPLPMHERIRELDRSCTAMMAEFREISRLERCGENWLSFSSILQRMILEVKRIGLENGIT